MQTARNPFSPPITGRAGMQAWPHPTLSSVGAAQRASLERGLSFFLILAVCCLVAAYGPFARSLSDSRVSPFASPVRAASAAPLTEASVTR